MEQGKLIQTINVIKAQECIDFLLTRPKQEIVGLGMLYGKPGLGKTTFATRTAFRNGYTYLRLEATSTPKTFAKDLLTSLYRNYCIGDFIPHGSTNTLFKQCIQILCEQEDAVIIIDEVDYAFRYHQLLGSIRDLADETLAVILLIGMQEAKDKLSRIDAHYFDRCNYFYEFQDNTKEDIMQVTKKVMSDPVDKTTTDLVWNYSKGNLRQAIKVIHMLEARPNKETPLSELVLSEAL